MDAPLLTLDRGNSTLDCLLHGANARRERLPADDPAALRAWLVGCAPGRCIAATVVPGGLDGAASVLRELGWSLQIAGRDLPCPLPIDYATPQTLGVDRWLGALAAHRAHGRAITVDCGSATTINLVEQDGTFRGGAIAPGLRALIAGMAQLTPHLPAAEPAQAVALPARSSAAAVHTGVALAFCGAIERLVADALAAARGPATVVITGGHAPDYLRHGRLRVQHEPALVHQGLRLLAASSCGC